MLQETKMNIVLVSKAGAKDEDNKAVHVEYMGKKKVFIVTQYESATLLDAYYRVKDGDFQNSTFAVQDIGYWLSLVMVSDPRVESHVRLSSGTILEHYAQRVNIETGVYRNEYVQYWLGDMAREGGYDIVEIRLSEEEREHLTSEK